MRAHCYRCWLSSTGGREGAQGQRLRLSKIYVTAVAESAATLPLRSLRVLTRQRSVHPNHKCAVSGFAILMTSQGVERAGCRRCSVITFAVYARLKLA